MPQNDSDYFLCDLDNKFLWKCPYPYAYVVLISPFNKHFPSHKIILISTPFFPTQVNCDISMNYWCHYTVLLNGSSQIFLYILHIFTPSMLFFFFSFILVKTNSEKELIFWLMKCTLRKKKFKKPDLKNYF